METYSSSQDYASRPATAWQTVIRIKRIIGICNPFIAPKTIVVRSSHSQILSIASWMKPTYVDFDDAGMLLDPMGKEAYGQPYDGLPVRWPVSMTVLIVEASSACQFLGLFLSLSSAHVKGLLSVT